MNIKLFEQFISEQTTNLVLNGILMNSQDAVRFIADDSNEGWNSFIEELDSNSQKEFIRFENRLADYLKRNLGVRFKISAHYSLFTDIGENLEDYEDILTADGVKYSSISLRANRKYKVNVTEPFIHKGYKIINVYMSGHNNSESYCAFKKIK
jgi:acylphosphatase